MTNEEATRILLGPPNAKPKFPSDFDALLEHHRATEAENASLRKRLALSTSLIVSSAKRSAQLRAVLHALVDKLDVIIPQIDSIIAFQTIRSGHQAYSGPNLIEELKAAKAALKEGEAL
jgi:hypothetical protein